MLILMLVLLCLLSIWISNFIFKGIAKRDTFFPYTISFFIMLIPFLNVAVASILWAAINSDTLDEKFKKFFE